MIVKLDSAAYHADPALSHSRLKVIGRSPMHFRWTSENGHPSSDVLDFGKLFHAQILEPETVAKDFAVGPEGIDRRTTAGKAAWAKFVEESAGKTIVTAQDMRTVQSMAAAIVANEGAADIVFDAIATGRVEEAHKWRDQFWQVDRKSKIDAVLSDRTVIDLKTTMDASPRAFERSILSYGYHTQAAFYADAMDACGEGMRRFIIIAVEKNPPFAIGVYELSSEAIAAGRRTVSDWMSRYVDCVASGSWPSYTETLQVIGLPKWATGKDSDGGAIEDF